MNEPKVIQRGVRVIYGTDKKYHEMPITNLPIGTIKVRTRWRNDRAAVAFVKTATTVEKWMLQPDGDNAIKLGFLQGVNTR